MLCKISGFHGGDDEQCRVLRNNIPVRISQETHYVSATEFSLVRVEVLMAVTTMNVVLWDVTPCDSSQLLRLLVTANAVPSSLILDTLMIVALRSSCSSLLTRATRRHIPEDEVFQLLNYMKMVSSGMLRRVALVRTDVSEEPSVSFIRVTRIGELGTTQAPTSISSQRTSVASCSFCS
jgi:hypothetical protein